MPKVDLWKCDRCGALAAAPAGWFLLIMRREAATARLVFEICDLQAGHEENGAALCGSQCVGGWMVGIMNTKKDMQRTLEESARRQRMRCFGAPREICG